MAAVFIISFPSDSNEQPGMRIQEILDFVTEICTESFIQVRNGYLTKPYFISLTNSRTNMVSFKIIFTPEYYSNITICLCFYATFTFRTSS